MSDLRFLRELGDEFQRVAKTHPSVQRSGRGRRRWVQTPRLATASFGLGLSVLIVVAVVIAVGSGVRTHGGASSSSPSRVVRVVFSVTSLDPGSPLASSLQRSIDILRQRLTAVVPGVQVSGDRHGLVVVVFDASRADRAQIIALAAPGKLAFYDWEANLLTPNGKTVASQLRSQDPTAIALSQGSGASGPGYPGSYSLSLYDAVKLASAQPSQPGPDNARKGPQYYLFGAPGSTACATLARDQGQPPVAGVHCLLSGPDSTRQDLLSGLPSGVSVSQGQLLIVSAGTVVVQAVPASFARQTPVSSPTAQFYVLKDHVALFGNDITNPQARTDQSGNPDVQFGFTSNGKAAFQRVTATIAHRGQTFSTLGQTLNQHFAVALDQQLITVPYISFNTYPDGLIGNDGAHLLGGFTTQSARDLAVMLRYGPLPVRLTAR